MSRDQRLADLLDTIPEIPQYVARELLEEIESYTLVEPDFYIILLDILGVDVFSVSDEYINQFTKTIDKFVRDNKYFLRYYLPKIPDIDEYEIFINHSFRDINPIDNPLYNAFFSFDDWSAHYMISGRGTIIEPFIRKYPLQGRMDIIVEMYLLFRKYVLPTL